MDDCDIVSEPIVVVHGVEDNPVNFVVAHSSVEQGIVGCVCSYGCVSSEERSHLVHVCVKSENDEW